MYRSFTLRAVVAAAVLSVLSVSSASAQRWHPSDAAIRKALLEPTSLEFASIEISTALQFLSDYHDIQILLDPSVKSAGVSPETAVSAQLRNLSLRSALQIVLGEHGLTWLIEDEVLKVVSLEAAEMRLSTRVYEVGDLVESKTGGAAELADVIRQAIAPNTWRDMGGNGVAAALGSQLLVVFNAPKVHYEVEDFLYEVQLRLEQAAERSTTTESDAVEPE